ncbi:protein argonaute-2-like [Lytechinus pictus]|uniref:protein argonaute-2-like n=1 Tax=Lytechinus pictus TaxID=7653 RepID=UPI0030BA2666
MKKALQQLELDVTLPGEGKDGMFKASIKFEGKVSMALPESALKGEVVNIPHDAVQALDVRMRHSPSLRKHRVPFIRARTWNQRYIWQKSPNWEHAIWG